MEREIKSKRALELLREAYPDSKIEVKETENPFADGVIVMDNSFVAWIEEGEVIVGESRLSKVLVDKE
jgi:hypothetical protein